MIKFLKGKIKQLRFKKQVNLPGTRYTKIKPSLAYFRYITQLKQMNLIIELNFDNSYSSTINEYKDFKNLCSILGIHIIEQPETQTILVVYDSYNDLYEMIHVFTNVYPWNNGNQFIKSIIGIVRGVPIINTLVNHQDIDAYGDVSYITILDNVTDVFIDNPNNFGLLRFDLDNVDTTTLTSVLCKSIVNTKDQITLQQRSLMSLIVDIHTNPDSLECIISKMNADTCNYIIRDKHLVKDSKYFIDPIFSLKDED